MLKDLAVFTDLDAPFGDEVGNANGSLTAVEGRGTMLDNSRQGQAV